jgi:hypothetical protein
MLLDPRELSVQDAHSDRGCATASASSCVSGATLRLSPRHLLALVEPSAALVAAISAAMAAAPVSSAPPGLITAEVPEETCGMPECSAPPLWSRFVCSEGHAVFERCEVRWTQLVPMRSNVGGSQEHVPKGPLALYHLSSTVEVSSASVSHELGATAAVRASAVGANWTPMWTPLHPHGHPPSADTAAAAAVGTFQNLPGGSEAAGNCARMLGTFADFVPSFSRVTDANCQASNDRLRDRVGAANSLHNQVALSPRLPAHAQWQVLHHSQTTGERAPCSDDRHIFKGNGCHSMNDKGTSQRSISSISGVAATGKGAVFCGGLTVVAKDLPGMQLAGQPQGIREVSPHAHPSLASPHLPKPHLWVCILVCSACGYRMPERATSNGLSNISCT